MLRPQASGQSRRSAAQRSSPQRALPAPLSPAPAAALDFGRSERAVRVNGAESSYAEDDLRAVLLAPTLPDALVVPKAGPTQRIAWRAVVARSAGACVLHAAWLRVACGPLRAVSMPSPTATKLPTPLCPASAAHSVRSHPLGKPGVLPAHQCALRSESALFASLFPARPLAARLLPQVDSVEHVRWLFARVGDLVGHRLAQEGRSLALLPLCESGPGLVNLK